MFLDLLKLYLFFGFIVFVLVIGMAGLPFNSKNILGFFLNILAGVLIIVFWPVVLIFCI